MATGDLLTTNVIRCEGCAKNSDSEYLPGGWVQFGESTKYRWPRGRRHLAAWCPDCIPAQSSGAEGTVRTDTIAVTREQVFIRALEAIWAGVPDRLREECVGKMDSGKLVTVPSLIGSLARLEAAIKLVRPEEP